MRRMRPELVSLFNYSDHEDRKDVEEDEEIRRWPELSSL